VPPLLDAELDLDRVGVSLDGARRDAERPIALTRYALNAAFAAPAEASNVVELAQVEEARVQSSLIDAR
jgi:hypothetical protein